MTSKINADNGVSSGSAGLKQTADNSGILEFQTNGTTAATVSTGQAFTFSQAANLPNTFGFKNRIMNGAMMIDQRNAGASVTQTTSDVFPVDRFVLGGSVTSKFTAQQNAGAVTPPAGFVNYLGITSSSAYTVGASEYFIVGQRIEGLSIADLGWGTANAQTVTLSFWVRSSLTGTFGGSARNSTGGRSYPFSYTISAANTWEQKTVTIPGDTSGTWLTTNGIGMLLYFGLGVGSTYSGTAGAWASSNYISATGATSVVGTNGATFYITGVQLEKGSTATSFDWRPYGTELALCQRYYWRTTAGGASTASWASGVIYASGTNARVHMAFPVPMRAAPTVSKTGTLYCATNGGAYTISSVANQWPTTTSALLDLTIAAGSSVGSGAVAYGSGTATDYVELTGAEL